MCRAGNVCVGRGVIQCVCRAGSVCVGRGVCRAGSDSMCV